MGLVNHGNLAALQDIRAMHEQHGIASSFLSAEEAMQRWPGMYFRGAALFVPDAGRVRAADALTALRQAAESRGAEFHYENPVRSIEVLNENLVLVVTDKGSYTASRVIVTAGAWTEKLLGARSSSPSLSSLRNNPLISTPSMLPWTGLVSITALTRPSTLTTIGTAPRMAC
ncbi:NAD(P)/FAD-dependent oxidoreductase [Arthrobacter psychrolactophilus]